MTQLSEEGAVKEQEEVTFVVDVEHVEGHDEHVVVVTSNLDCWAATSDVINNNERERFMMCLGLLTVE